MRNNPTKRNTHSILSHSGRILSTTALHSASFILIFVMLAWLIYPPLASAHAQLIRSTPAAGALLDASPQTMRLEFSESVSLDFSMVQIYNRTRQEQTIGALGQPSGEDNVIKASLPNALPAGTYTVVWRIISAADGHVTAGSYAFRVRDTTGAAGTTDDTEPIAPDSQLAAAANDQIETADPFRWAIRTLMMAGGILILGGTLFTIGIASPTVADTGDKGARLSPFLRERFGALGAVSALVVILMLFLDLVAQVMAIKSVGFLDALNSTSIAWELLTSTLYGLGWFAKLAAAILLVSVMLFIWRKPRQTQPAKARSGPASWDVAIVAGSLFILGLSLSSHAAAVHTESTAAAATVTAATESHEHGLGLPLPVLADWLHAAMASLWVGGLFYMALVLFPAFKLASFSPEDRRAFLARGVPRFSRLAILSVITIAVTGTYSVITHSNDLGTIFSTEYGLVLAAKIAAYCVLVGIGAINLLRLTPKLQQKVAGGRQKASTVIQEQTKPTRLSLADNIRIEAAIAVIAIICAAGLTLLPPPSGPTETAAAVLPSPTIPAQNTPAPATSNVLVAGYNITLTAKPSSDGDTLTANVVGASGASAPLTDVAKVLFRITPQDIDAGGTSYIADAVGAPIAQSGAWSTTQSVFTLDGSYLVTVIVQRTVAPDMKAGFQLDLLNSTLTSIPIEVVDVLVATDPSPPISGTVTLNLTLHDGAGQPVDNAKISVTPRMPASNLVEPTGVAQPVPNEPGKYTLPVQFQLDGSWLLLFDVERTGKPAIRTDASLDVANPEATPTP